METDNKREIQYQNDCMDGTKAIHKIMLDFGNEVVVFWIDKEPYRRPFRNQMDKSFMRQWVEDKEDYLKCNRFAFNFRLKQVELFKDLVWDHNSLYPAAYRGDMWIYDVDDLGITAEDVMRLCGYTSYDDIIFYDEEEEDLKRKRDFLASIPKEDWDRIMSDLDKLQNDDDDKNDDDDEEE